MTPKLLKCSSSPHMNLPKSLLASHESETLKASLAEWETSYHRCLPCEESRFKELSRAFLEATVLQSLSVGKV